MTFVRTYIKIMLVQKGGENLTPRTGRPTDDPKTLRVGIRLSEVESEKLDYCCEKLALSKTEVIKKGINKVYNELIKK